MAKILIVDDNMDLCQVLADVLAESGMMVTVSYSGEDALKQLKRESFDLMILDYYLLGKTGLDVIEEARGLISGTRVIMISAFGNSHLKERVMELEAVVGFLDKPFKISRIAEIVREALEKKDE